MIKRSSRRQSYRQLLPAVILLLFLLPLLTACWGSSRSADLSSLLVDELAEPIATLRPVTLRIMGSSAPGSHELALLSEFTDRTGITVQYVRGPAAMSERQTLFHQFLDTGSADVDIFQISPEMTSTLAPHLLDLRPYFTNPELSPFFPLLLKFSMVGERLLAIPWFANMGLLFYRTDLLEQYGFSAPPKSWAELTEMATTVQAGEREKNRDLWGFVWAGANTLDLMENALEWQASSGGGQIVEAGGRVTVNNPQAIAALDRAASWVGTISPMGITAYTEENCEQLWRNGQTLFMRAHRQQPTSAANDGTENPYAVAPLPSQDGASHPVGILGGGQLAVSRYSTNPDAAILFIKFVTSPEKQIALFDGDVSRLPTAIDAYSAPALVAQYPFLSGLPMLLAEGVMTLPYSGMGQHFEALAALYTTETQRVLTGQQSGAAAVATMEREMRALLTPDLE